MTFEQFNLNPKILKTLQELGYETPTPIQEKTIPLLLENHDVIGCAQTGTGKTAAFALPILQKLKPGAKNPKAVVIAPTRELAIQVHESIVDYGRLLSIRTVLLYGGTPKRPQIFQLDKGVDIIVATPGRLLDHLKERSVRLYEVEFLVLDEADRMLDMGFIPDIEEILSYIPRERQTLLFSATMPPEIDRLAHSITKDPETVIIGARTSAADTVTQSIFEVSSKNKFALLLELLKTHDMDSVIIFCKTKMGAHHLAEDLNRHSFAAAEIHANLAQVQRERVMDGFKRGDFKMLVATDIAARGLDINSISHVINYDTPTHPEDYVHRVGRTGRAETTGDAFTFTSREELKYLKSIERLIKRELPRAEHHFKSHSGDSERTSSPSNSRHREHHSPKATQSKRPRTDNRQERPRTDNRQERPRTDNRQERPRTDNRQERPRQTEKPASRSPGGSRGPSVKGGQAKSSQKASRFAWSPDDFEYLE